MDRKAGIPSEAIHGNKSQKARQRALENFKTGNTKVLVATDIAARGIDVDELALVINYDLPNVPETYVHRIGRTGRARASGIAISFCDVEERPYLRSIEKLINQRIPITTDHPFADEQEERVSSSNNQNSRSPERSSSSRRKHNQRRNWRKKNDDRREDRRRRD